VANVAQQGQQTSTGATNLEYDLVAEMHELLEGNAAIEHYIEDAKGAGDGEAERCFMKIRDTNREHVSELRQILSKCLAQAPDGS
jgi:hypothetical protein